MKKRYFAIPILAIALHFLLSNLLYSLVERLVLDVFHISPQQFMNYSYCGEILIYAVLILVFFTLYKLLWRKEISEPAQRQIEYWCRAPWKNRSWEKRYISCFGGKR